MRSLCLKQRNIIVLAAELLNALENSIRGQSINLEIILKSCNAVVETGEELDVSFSFCYYLTKNSSYKTFFR